MATTINPRLFQMAEVIDTYNPTDNWINVYAKPTTGKFQTASEPANYARSTILDSIEYYYLPTTNNEFSFSGTFTIGFWARFPEGSSNTETNQVSFQLAEGDLHEYDLSDYSSVDITADNWYSFHRDAAGNVTISIGGVTIDTFESASTVDFKDGKSFIKVGNFANNGSTGDKVIIDDLIIADSVLSCATTIPTTYINSYDNTPAQESDKYYGDGVATDDSVYIPLRIY